MVASSMVPFVLGSLLGGGSKDVTTQVTQSTAQTLAQSFAPVITVSSPSSTIRPVQDTTTTSSPLFSITPTQEKRDTQRPTGSLPSLTGGEVLPSLIESGIGLLTPRQSNGMPSLIPAAASSFVGAGSSGLKGDSASTATATTSYIMLAALALGAYFLLR